MNEVHGAYMALSDASLCYKSEQLDYMEETCRRAGVQPPHRRPEEDVAHIDEVNTIRKQVNYSMRSSLHRL